MPPGHSSNLDFGIEMKDFRKRVTSNRIAFTIFLIISIVFTSPIFKNIHYHGMHDMGEFEFYHAVPRKTIIQYQQIPLWNPYQCGGQVLLGDPQSVFLSPTFLINLVFGTIIGIKIKIFAYLLAGLYGMFQLSKYLKIKGVSAYLPPFVFMLSSIYPLHIVDGMLWILPMAYIPWAILFYLKTGKKYAIYTAITLSFMFLEGGTYIPIHTILFIGIYSFLKDIQEKRIRNTKKVFAIIVITLLICSVKLLPMMEFVLEHPHRLMDYSGFSVNSFIHSIFDRDQNLLSERYFSNNKGFLFGMSWYWVSNGMYIGFIPFILYLAGLAKLGKKHMPLIVTSLFFLWLSFGHRAPLSIYELLRTLPVFESLRIATRYRFFFLLGLSLIAGLAASRIENSRKLDSSRIKRMYALSASLMIILIGLTIFSISSKEFLFQVGERIYDMRDHAHEFEYFHYFVEIIYNKIITNLAILSSLSIITTMLMCLFLSDKITFRQLRSLIVYGMLVFVLFDLTLVNSPIFSEAFISPPFQKVNGTFMQTENITIEKNYSSEYFKFGDFFRKMRGNVTFRATLEKMSYSSMYPNFLRNMGSISCINPMIIDVYATAAESEDYKGEAYLLNGMGDVEITYFSPNKVVVEFTTQDNDYLILNQNYFRGWKVEGNKFGKVESMNGLVSTRVNAGEHQVVFYYMPESFVLGGIVSIASLFACILFCFRQGSRAVKYGGP